MIFPTHRTTIIAMLCTGLLCHPGCERGRHATAPAPSLEKSVASANAASEMTGDSTQVVRPPTASDPDPTSPNPVSKAEAAAGMQESPSPLGDEPPSPTGDDENTDSRTSHGLSGPSQGSLPNQPGSSRQPPGQSDPPAAFRLLLPTTCGPLVVDLDISIEGEPLSEAYEQRIDQLLREAAPSQSLSWTELLDYVRSKPRQFGPIPAETSAATNLTTTYDRNRNGLAEREEAIHFLFRDSPFHRPFRLIGSDAFRGVNRSESVIFHALDRDSNQRLDADEMQNALAALSRLDRNEDQRLDSSEVTSLVQSRRDDPWDARRTKRWGTVAMDLNGFVDWSMLSYSLDGMNQQAVFQQDQHGIASLDRNQDQSIDQEEAKGLREIPADLRLKIQYDAFAASPPQIEAKLFANAEAARVVSSETGNGIRVVGHDLILMVLARDSINRDSLPAQAFARLDSDQDGGLDESEIPSGALGDRDFKELDQDQDGRLTRRELLDGLNPELPVWSIQVRARGAEAPDALFAWLDSNQDLSLSTRELHGCEHKLRQRCPVEAELGPVDFPDTFVLQFGRGAPQQEDSLFSFAAPQPMANHSEPKWAQSMDLNQDGDISRSEFLGSSDQFDRLDQNGDQFLDREELD